MNVNHYHSVILVNWTSILWLNRINTATGSEYCVFFCMDLSSLCLSLELSTWLSTFYPYLQASSKFTGPFLKYYCTLCHSPSLCAYAHTSVFFSLGTVGKPSSRIEEQVKWHFLHTVPGRSRRCDILPCHWLWLVLRMHCPFNMTALQKDYDMKQLLSSETNKALSSTCVRTWFGYTICERVLDDK